ncbi:MAG: cupin domain-containing protein [Candidatus Omnitrophica bacterium]|nr:cupin domain-containing protein [Candidatus Omnitrophota bacterium]MDD5573762.1 cupin domain-containing protein [Candidatus Omnitrophota bacterium]
MLRHVTDLKGSVAYAPQAIVSKTIVEKPAGTMTVFAFDAGQNLSEHTAPFDAVVEVLEGQAELLIGDDEVVASAGSLVVMPANVPHAVFAKERFKMLLTMIKG